MKQQKTVISERALFQRLKRYLEKEEGQLLKKCRPTEYYNELADYYILDISTNSIFDKGLSLKDLEDYGHKYKVLSKNETVSKS